MAKSVKHILPTIVLAQFACTSLWFAGNAVMPDLQQLLQLPPAALGWATSAVQLGFITGTLLSATLVLADRFAPSLIFMLSALAAAIANLGIYFWVQDLYGLLLCRFLVGFFLAGIYPIGMKIASDWYPHGLGKAIGWLVGALVLGTSFPHLIKSLGDSLPWEYVMLATSAVAVAGGLLLFALVPKGPYARSGARFHWGVIPHIFEKPNFRAAAFGYFGHMWELYAFWAFMPIYIWAYVNRFHDQTWDISFWSFAVISVGSIGCILGGYASVKAGSARVAFGQLSLSGLCCLVSPWVFWLSPYLFFPFLLIWGISVVGDSPQFSALNAREAPPELVGTALTIVNSLGFAISIFSIEWVNFLSARIPVEYIFLLLLPGPLLGLWSLMPLLRNKKA